MHPWKQDDNKGGNISESHIHEEPLIERNYNKNAFHLIHFTHKKNGQTIGRCNCILVSIVTAVTCLSFFKNL